MVLLANSKLRYACLPIAVLGFAIANGVLSNSVAAWAVVSQAITQPIAVCGPLLGAFAAWDAANYGRPGSLSRFKLAPDFGLRALSTIWLSGVIWSIFCYLIWGSAVAIEAFLEKPWGQPTWSWIVSGALSLAAQASVGSAIGFIWPTFLAPAITAMLIFATNGALVLLPGWHNQSFLSGGFTQVQQVAFEINEAVLWSQALWFSGVAILGLSICTIRLGAPFSTSMIRVTVGLLIATTGLIQVVNSRDGFFKYEHSGWQYVCSGKPSICLHPAFANKRDEISLAIASTLGHIEGTPFSSNRYEWTNRGYLGEPSKGSIAFHLDRFSSGWQSQLRLELSRDLLTAGSAVGGPCDATNDESETGAFAGLKSIVAAWLAETPSAAIPFGREEEAAATRFAKMTEAQKNLWLSANVEKICSSKLKPNDF